MKYCMTFYYMLLIFLVFMASGFNSNASIYQDYSQYIDWREIAPTAPGGTGGVDVNSAHSTAKSKYVFPILEDIGKVSISGNVPAS